MTRQSLLLRGMITLGLIFTFSHCGKKAASSGPNHPWQMFRGYSDHLGYAAVTGPQTGVVKWKVNTGNTNPGTGPNSVVVSSDGTIYVGGSPILALDRLTGTQKWSYSISCPGQISGSMCAARDPAISNDGNTIYVAVGASGQGGLAPNSVGWVIALSKSGALQWSTSVNGFVPFGPTVAPDDTIYQGSWDGNIYAISPSGAVKWKTKTLKSGGCFSYSGGIGPDGTFYVGGGDAHCGQDPYFYALNPSDGSIKWSIDTSSTTGNTDSAHQSTPAITSSGALLFSAFKGILMETDLNGKVKFTMGSLKNDVIGIQTPAVGPTYVYSASDDGNIRQLDLNSQTVAWAYLTGTEPSGPNKGQYGIRGFPVTDKNGNVYVGAVDHNMYGLNSSGKALFVYSTANDSGGGDITEASPALDSDGNLYFTAENGYIYSMTGGQ